ncbi:hypothetical protein S7S_12700 [Isoalcanivorax pacificus W11-5]|uniref:Uncharacterized protein n=1 Tax=Isoalcanivorax pacificus W11-5 TaxID=391936 RepID=A0A0B4XRW0_9GAMM|nr:hypothetical protein S7S_12700 [Isoalcanivorax pacificus W11-5]
MLLYQVKTRRNQVWLIPERGVGIYWMTPRIAVRECGYFLLMIFILSAKTLQQAMLLVNDSPLKCLRPPGQNLGISSFQ